MAANLASDAANWAASGFGMAPKEVAQARLAVCEACEFYKDKRCKKCGCFMEAKAAMGSSKCPEGKWEK